MKKSKKSKIIGRGRIPGTVLSKLQENMKQAQGEFKELNKALKDITFSNERYEFYICRAKAMENIMI